MDDLFSLQYLMNSAGRLIEKEKILRNKDVFAYFFSSSTCQPGNELLPLLRKIYEEAKQREISLEIIYVSSDTDEEAMLRHFFEQHYGWCAIPVNEIAITELHLQYDITHEPQIVVVSREGEIVSRKGKADILELGVNVLIKWLRPYVV
ncbi:putative thioredoxin-disulfide reductase [Trypoxylus dichotomus]